MWSLSCVKWVRRPYRQRDFRRFSKQFKDPIRSRISSGSQAGASMVCWQRATKVRSPGILKDVSADCCCGCFSEFAGNGMALWEWDGMGEAYTRCWLHELWQHSLGPSGGLSVYDHGRPRARIAEVSQFNVASVFLKCPRWRSEEDSSLIHDQTWRSKSALPESNDWIWSSPWISIALFCQAGPISCTECRIAMTSLQGPQNDQGQEETGQACHFASIQEDRQ